MPPKGKDFSRLKPQPTPPQEQQPQTDASSASNGPNDAASVASATAASTAAPTSTSATTSVPASSTTTQPVAMKVGKGKHFGRIITAPSTSQMPIPTPPSMSSSQPHPQPPAPSQPQPSQMQSSSTLIHHSPSDKPTATTQGGTVSQQLTAQQLAKQKQLRKYQQTLADKAKKLTRTPSHFESSISASMKASSSTQTNASMKLQALCHQIDPSFTLDPEVESRLVDLADSFVVKVTRDASKLSRHRGSKTLDANDIALALKKGYNMSVPGGPTMDHARGHGEGAMMSSNSVMGGWATRLESSKKKARTGDE
mmetsp:Transcript_35179/g.78898  ORF Transcript_35179/g.78898 Transcript_35179/m.78898 type:complete len:311 (+) Transcript_35179:51-983(+)